MSALLDDIINLALDGKNPLPDILRKCLLLGHELKNEQLKTWANQELNGYESGLGLPEYRIVPAPAKGNFVGPFYAQYNDHIIPSVVLEEKHREFAEQVYLLQPIGAYVDTLEELHKNPSGSLTFPWNANMVAYYQAKLMGRGFICHSAWQEIATNAIADLLESVRNRTLNMALQIKDELGTSYENLRNIKSGETITKIENIIFQNTGGAAVAFGQAKVDTSQHQFVINAGDRSALDKVLTHAGLEKEDLAALTQAIDIDGNKKPGGKVSEWIKTNASKVLSGGVKVGTHIGQEILTAWIKAHYGIK